MPPVARRFPRVLGRFSTGRPGPTVVVSAGLHGNEPAGVLAAQRVLGQLEKTRLPLRGELLALAGNLAALEVGRRYLVQDLNRCWIDAAVRVLEAQDEATDDAEQREQRELLRTLRGLGDRRIVLLDLHTTSGDSPPFTLMSDTLRNRRIAFALPIPVILGLEEEVDGTLLEYMTEQGHTVAVVESGQHEDPRAADFHEAVIWCGLVAAGALDAGDVPDYERLRERLAWACRGLPRVVEVTHRHALDGDEAFRMRPGFLGFQPVRKGDLLAHDRTGDVRAPKTGLLLMPLYQTQGDEGFFIVRPVNRAWLWFSALLRRLRLQYALLWLPGVSRHPGRIYSLRVDPKVARWLVIEIFHLFGYRKVRRENDHLIFSRRRPG